jgi:hypothetical protein
MLMRVQYHTKWCIPTHFYEYPINFIFRRGKTKNVASAPGESMMPEAMARLFANATPRHLHGIIVVRKNYNADPANDIRLDQVEIANGRFERVAATRPVTPMKGR